MRAVLDPDISSAFMRVYPWLRKEGKGHRDQGVVAGLYFQGSLADGV